MSFTWVDILIGISGWAAMVGAGLATVVTIIMVILQKGQWSNEQWNYAGIAFLCGFVVTFLTVLVMIYSS